jgi:hypothetical protein
MDFVELEIAIKRLSSVLRPWQNCRNKLAIVSDGPSLESDRFESMVLAEPMPEEVDFLIKMNRY